MTASARRWGWFILILACTPAVPLFLGAISPDASPSVESWSDYQEPPWYLVALVLTPLPGLLYALVDGKLRPGRVLRP